MEPQAVFCSWILFAFVCGFLGALIGHAKDAVGPGFALGFFLGPLGLIAAFAVDCRHRCPACLERLWRLARICPHCRTNLEWHFDGLSDIVKLNTTHRLLADTTNEVKASNDAQRQREQEAAVEAGRQRIRERDAHREHEAERQHQARMRESQEQIKRFVGSAKHVARNVPSKIDAVLQSMVGQENVILYRFLKLFVIAGLAAGLVILTWAFL